MTSSTGWTGPSTAKVARPARQINRDGRQPIQTVYGAGYRFVAEEE